MILDQLLSSLSIDSNHGAKISAFLDLFEKWNRRINLSGASSREELLEHVEDCLHVVPHLTTSTTVLDVGSGGGFPVVIAAICLPGTQFVALEPVHKKHAYLSTAARELSLGNLSARSERLEDHTGRGYGAATSRATFDIARWISLGRRYVVKGGKVIGFEALPQAGLDDVQRHPYRLGEKTRSIIVAVV